MNLSFVFALLMSCLNRFGPRSGGCCGDCELFADDFERSDSSDLGSDWTEAAGNWEIDSAALTVGTSNVLAVHATTLSASYYRVRAKLSSDTASDVLGVVAFYSDTSNYYSAEVTLHDASPVLSIYKTVSGSRTLLRSATLLAGEADVDSPVELILCLDQAGTTGTLLTAELSTNPGRTRITASDASLSGPGKAGVWAKTATGTVAFDDFAVESTEDADANCPDCGKECQACRHGMPDQFQAVVDEPLSCPGNVCPNLNATYTLDFDGVNGSGWCQWSLDIPQVSCNVGTYDRITLEVLGTGGLRVSLGDASVPGRTVWQDLDSNIVELFADDFDRADSSNLGADWTEAAGDWEIDSNRLSVADDDALAVHASALTSSGYQVSTVVRSDTADDLLGAVAYYADTDNYYEAIVKIHNTAPAISLYKTVAGTRTLLATRSLSSGDASLESDIYLALLVQQADGGTVLVADLGTTFTRIAAFDASLSGPGTAGVIARTAAGDVEFDDFMVESFDCQAIQDRTPGLFINGPCSVSGGAAVSVSAL